MDEKEGGYDGSAEWEVDVEAFKGQQFVLARNFTRKPTPSPRRILGQCPTK